MKHASPKKGGHAMPFSLVECEHCGSTEDVFPEEVYTSYYAPWKGQSSRVLTRFERILERDDPQPIEDDRVFLCGKCADYHHWYWRDLLEDYHRSVMGPPQVFTNSPLVGFSRCEIP
jgi:DNA-directed RNA polymerase subunit M/transcription elongation factor TFIIS